MVRNKYVARRPSKKSWSYGRGPIYSPFSPFVGASPQTSRHYENEILQKEDPGQINNQSYSTLSSKLRYSRITFVSAGTLESDFPKDEASAANDTRPDSVELSLSMKTQIYQNSPPKLDDSARNEASFKVTRSDGFIIDLHGSDPIQTGLSPPTIRSRSPASSDSSEEIILFKGRKYFVDNLTEKILDLGDNNIDDTINSTRKHNQELILERSKNIMHKIPDKNASTKFIESNLNELQNSKLIDFALSPRIRKSKKQLDDELMTDYLANIDSEDTNAMISFTRRDLGGSTSSNYSSMEIESLIDSLSESLHEKLTLDFQDVHIHEDGSSSHNSVDLTQREYKNKIGSGTTKKNTIKSETSSTPDIFGLNMYDMLGKQSEYLDDEISKSGSPSSSDQDFGNSLFPDLCSKNKICRRDCNLEKVFAQYEELEIGSEGISHLNDLEVTNFLKKGTGPLLPKKKSRKKDKKKSSKKTMKEKKRNLSGSGRTLHVYDDIFDVMGFDRPSLNKGKDRKTNLSSAIKMPNSEAYIEMQLQKDLLKKKERRKAREKSRSLGLLGSKSGNPRLQISYKDGLKISELKKEFKIFLQSDRDCLVLPPMAKTDRKIVHEIANIFKLKSNSRGTGNKRFATLYRTSHTIRFTDDIFNTLEARLFRRFFPSISIRAKSTSKKKSQCSGASKIAVSYQEGDIVGGSAPEISADNRGRAMLEKMGWSTGTALGALNNKGILQPVSHVVKISKAGLG